MNGVLVVNKPKEFTSFDVVALVRKLSGQRKIGHTGTLDPNATGVLPLLLGNATKAQDIIINHDKEYEAEFRLGFTSDTLDVWGNVRECSDKKISREDIEKIIPDFTGKIQQIPPMFSAVQKDGKRLYDLARQGIEVERQPREVTVYSLALTNFDERTQTGALKIKCSKGTYVRTLIDDMGRVLECGGIMTALNRTNACGYCLDDALTLQQIKSLAENHRLEEKLFSTESLFGEYKSITVTQAQARRFLNGGALDISRTALAKGCNDKEIFRVNDREKGFLGLGQTDLNTNQLKIYKNFTPGR